ncbi:elongation of very long chain fatty acids protein 6-like isoform X1 [Brienomyrus brachyistius]|uniref:elongation of very long chain fatty acids protein 6-like isoform X1 n=2 Tax=Brienomyrus brachyistius TaxID=42636 RepID=UPI0020B2126C|nr:elongation of very long chain fatty acids protein 6-like isoform X1 [Brienomyrus brachyistius]
MGGDHGRVPRPTAKMNETEQQLPLTEYDFERHFDERVAIQWMQQNWRKSFVFCGLYAALVFGGQYFMRQRPKLDLRKPLVLWSLSLAIFSIIGAVRTGWYMLYILHTSGFKQSVCDQGFYSAPVSKFWAYAFVVSKAPELGDTVFIVLRKQRLIFLHWYHHITVLLYSWYSYKDQVAGGGWFMTMNYLVHAFMYSYYAVRAAGVRVPRPLAMVITAIQIAQMVMGLAISALVYRWMQEDQCPSYLDNIVWATLMYLSYLLLFSSFFYKSYLKGRGSKGGKED